MNWNNYNPFVVYQYPLYNYMWSVVNPKPEEPTIDIDISDAIPNPSVTNSLPPLQIAEEPLEILKQKNEYRDQMLKKRKLRKQKLLKKRERQDNFQQKKQKKDRNIPSNIFKYFLAYIAKIQKLPQIAKKILNEDTQFDHTSFRLKVKQFFKNNNGYIRLLTMKQLCQSYYLNENQSLVFRVLLHKFLLLELPLQIIQMPKYKKRQRRQFMKIGRNINNQIMINGYLND